MTYRVLTNQTASTKADHGIRSRVLISDFKKTSFSHPGEPCWLENPENPQQRFIGTISILSSLKPNTCLLSSESLEEIKGWSKLNLQKVDFDKPAEKILLENDEYESDIWSKSTRAYITQRLDNLIVSEGSSVGIFLSGLFKTFRVSKTIPSNCAVRINRETIVSKKKNADFELLNENQIDKEPFAGLDDELDKLVSIINEGLEKHLQSNKFRPPRGALLYGPPGTGKSLLCKRAVELVNAKMISVLDEFTALSTITNAYSAGNGRCVLFIDEIDMICENSREIVSTLLTLTDRDDSTTFLLACTNRPEVLDPALRRPGRIDEEIEIPPPNMLQRKSILWAHLQMYPHEVLQSEAEQVSNSAHGFVGADLKLLCSEAAFLALERGQDKIIKEDLKAALKKVQPSCLREVQITVPQVRWEDIGGMEKVKTLIRETVELPLKHPEVFKRLGISPPQGVLLYGPPGCSKTLLAKAVATESEMNFIAVKGPELLSKWVGDSEKAIQSTFRRARQSKPCVIFFDEIDALAGSRDSASSSGVSQRVTSQLLQELDGIEARSGVIILCATNRPDLLDPALLRPGRIDRCVYVHPPDLAARIEILKIHLKKIPHDFNLDCLDQIETEGFSGAEVASICRDAALKALEANKDSISLEDLKIAARKVSPQITERILHFYESFEKQLN